MYRTGEFIDSAPDSFIDNMLLESFPGRFLEEIDEQVDFFRWWRASKGVERIRGVEERFKLFSQDKISKDAMSGDWDDLAEHEKLLAEYGKYN